ncbi:hypothetical protein [Wolbachia endosymbiont (group A) of Nomada hirtipes]|uniref:hypothetical protein n=1 Tax=Wolbachia endosymbiont (group A) of Nomada hirtipes TaxID=3066208 RepID=UPI0030D4A679
MLLACYSHKHISYRIRTIIRKAIKSSNATQDQSTPQRFWLLEVIILFKFLIIYDTELITMNFKIKRKFKENL